MTKLDNDLRKGEELKADELSGLRGSSSPLNKLKRYNVLYDSNPMTDSWLNEIGDKSGEWVRFDDVKDWHSKQDCPANKRFDSAELKRHGWRSPKDWQKAKDQLKSKLSRAGISSIATESIIDEILAA